MSQSCLLAEPRRTPAAVLGGNSRRGDFVLDAGRFQLGGHVRHGRRWGWDGASLELTSECSEDPIGINSGDVNFYRYCGNDPVNWTDPSGLEYAWWAGTKAFCHTLFVEEIYGGGKALVTGEAGRALGERCVQIVEKQTGKGFTGSASEWGRFGRAAAGDIVGTNQIVEGVGGYDIATYGALDASERVRRGAAGTAALAGTAAGGLSAATKAPGLFPTAARAAGVTTATATEGIYEFTSASGKTYVGQSGNIPARIEQHLASGKLLKGDLSTVRTTEVLGGKTAREVAEQLRINELGGVRNLENIRNPIGPKRQHLLPKTPGGS